MKHLRKRIGFLVLLICLSGLSHALGEALFEDSAFLIRDGFLREAPVQERIIHRGESFEEYMIACLEARQTEIAVSQFLLTPDEYRFAYTSLINSHPELFYAPGSWKYSLTDDGHVKKVLIQYLYSESEIASKTAAFNASVLEFMKRASQADTALGKVMIVHDELCVRYEYDSSLDIHSAEEMFRVGKGVCQGYLQCFQAVMNELEIPCIPVISEEMKHGWNMVSLNGNWYHVDVTWDDPVSSTVIPLRAMHEYFLLSDAKMLASEHYGWSASAEAASTTYDSFFWSALNTPVAVNEGRMYYVDPVTAGATRTVMAWDMLSGVSEQVLSYQIYNAAGTAYHLKGYYPLCVTPTHLYYMKCDRAYAVPLSGGTAVLTYAVPDSSTIWSAYYDGSSVQLYADGAPGGGADVVSLSGSKARLTASPNIMHLKPGESASFTARVIPGVNASYRCSWTSSKTSVAAVSSAGSVTGVSAGLSVVTCTYSDGLSAARAVVVHSPEQIVLPTGTTTVSDEAFCASAVTDVVLPEGVLTIGSRAFADCDGLMFINLPSSLVSIADDAFENTSGVILLCKQGTLGETFAKSSGLSYLSEP